MTKAEKQFAEAMAKFGKRLGQLDASNPNVKALTTLLPRLLPTGVVNEVEGDIEGDVVQIGSQLGGLWSAASTYVGNLQDKKLSEAYVTAAAAAAACAPGVRNTARGTIRGKLFQIGNVDGDINI